MSAPAVVGVLLAAGKGSRMGRTKQLIVIPTGTGAADKKSLVAVAFDAIVSVCDQMVVVVGAEQQRVIEALQPRQFTIAHSSADAEMIKSVLIGLQCGLQLDGSAVFLLQPGDHYHVDPETLNQLIDTAQQFPEQTIIPRFADRGGHPILIPPTIARTLVEQPPFGGLNSFWRENETLCRWIEVDDRSVIRDLDTPSDLERLE